MNGGSHSGQPRPHNIIPKETSKTPAAPVLRCRTRYPLLLVHGVGFREQQGRLMRYWGRIPAVLGVHGARVFLSRHDAWADLETGAKQTAAAALRAMEQTGGEKINLIGHSMGGLVARRAACLPELRGRVASITTIAAPHHGSETIEKLCKSRWLLKFVSHPVNAVFKFLGDRTPDFYRACLDITSTACREFNMRYPAPEGVYCQSYGARVSGAFSDGLILPLYLIVRFFEGENDGLLTSDTVKWENFQGYFSAKGQRRGISHADLVDLRSRDVGSLHVPELYIRIVERLKQAGL